MSYWYVQQNRWISKWLCWVKNTDKKEDLVCDPIYIYSRKCRLIYSGRKQIVSCRRYRWKGEYYYSGVWGNIGEADGFTDIHMSNYIKGSFLYVSYAVKKITNNSILYRFDYRKYCFNRNLGLLLKENIYLSNTSIVKG